MIAVIADDLTGAAEIGGVGLQYNLRVEISTRVNAASTADLLIINTDSRSKSKTDAVAAVKEVCSQLKSLQPQFIYKKIDSVLRGHVLAEMEAEMSVWGWLNALIVPANPHLGRTFVNNVYLINNVPVHQTSFAHDPEFPVSNCNAAAMLKDDKDTVLVQKHTQSIVKKGIVVGEVANADDLFLWAQCANSYEHLAGSASFFSALLSKGYHKNQADESTAGFLTAPVLYVSGTTFANNAEQISSLAKQGGPVSYMPTMPSSNQQELDSIMTKWSDEVSTLLYKQHQAVIAVKQANANEDKFDALLLRQAMAVVVKKVLDKVKVKELIIEGGSTAAAILNCLNIESLVPVHEFAPGIIRCSAMFDENIHVTLKPGSYPWSEKTWVF